MNSLQYRILATASFFAFTAILIGAMGAHFLKDILTPKELNSIETGVRYQMYHALAMLLVALLNNKMRPALLKIVFYIFTAGIICFSFSIYAFVTIEVIDIDLPKILYLITPIGGLALASGWAIIFFNSLKHLYLRGKDKGFKE